MSHLMPHKEELEEWWDKHPTAELQLSIETDDHGCDYPVLELVLLPRYDTTTGTLVDVKEVDSEKSTDEVDPR